MSRPRRSRVVAIVRVVATVRVVAIVERLGPLVGCALRTAAHSRPQRTQHRRAAQPRERPSSIPEGRALRTRCAHALDLHSKTAVGAAEAETVVRPLARALTWGVIATNSAGAPGLASDAARTRTPPTLEEPQCHSSRRTWLQDQGRSRRRGTRLWSRSPAMRRSASRRPRHEAGPARTMCRWTRGAVQFAAQWVQAGEKELAAPPGAAARWTAWGP